MGGAERQLLYVRLLRVAPGGATWPHSAVQSYATSTLPRPRRRLLKLTSAMRMKPIIDMDESNFEIEQQLDGIKMKIGFIGLGIMGSRMAANLQKHNYSLVVFNRTRDKAESLLDRGATLADSPPKLAEQVDVLFTMLAHPDAVEQAALGANGFLSHLKPNALWVDCSSVNPSFSQKMAAEAARRQIRFVDAPVTGSAPVAAEAKLTFWVGANEVDLEVIRS